MPENTAGTGSDYRRKLRYRVALLTGLITMRDELESDILEVMNGMGTASINGMNGMGSVTQSADAPRRGRPPKLLPAPDATTIQANAPAEAETEEVKKPRTAWSAAARKRKSEELKARWAAFKAGNKQRPFNKYAKAKKAARVKETGKETKRVYYKVGPKIGFGTNAEFLYTHAMEHGGRLDVKGARAAAAKTPNHKNLAGGGRLTVALAEMKRKGFMEHGKEIGSYALTPLATRVRQQEMKQQG